MSFRISHLWDAWCQVHDWLEFDVAAGEDAVFRDLDLARSAHRHRQPAQGWAAPLTAASACVGIATGSISAIASERR